MNWFTTTYRTDDDPGPLGMGSLFLLGLIVGWIFLELSSLRHPDDYFLNAVWSSESGAVQNERINRHHLEDRGHYD